MPAAGYSGTPLAQKLGITEGTRVRVEGAPDNYRQLLAPVPARAIISPRLRADIDTWHLFATRRKHLAARLKEVRGQMRQDAAVWVSWPKMSSGLPTDVTEDVVRAVALPMGLVDVKVCAVDEIWSGLKLVIRKELRR